MDEAIAKARLRAGELRGLLQRSTQLFVTHKVATEYLRQQIAKVQGLVQNCDTRVKTLQGELERHACVSIVGLVPCGLVLLMRC